MKTRRNFIDSESSLKKRSSLELTGKPCSGNNYDVIFLADPVRQSVLSVTLDYHRSV